jgi:hypothetical protein
MTSDELATCTTPQMMSFPETSLEWAQVTAETLNKTYNSKDLDPTEVNKELSDILDKGSSEDNVEINTAAHASVVSRKYVNKGGRFCREWNRLLRSRRKGAASGCSAGRRSRSCPPILSRFEMSLGESPAG